MATKFASNCGDRCRKLAEQPQTTETRDNLIQCAEQFERGDEFAVADEIAKIDAALSGQRKRPTRHHDEA